MFNQSEPALLPTNALLLISIWRYKVWYCERGVNFPPPTRIQIFFSPSQEIKNHDPNTNKKYKSDCEEISSISPGSESFSGCSKPGGGIEMSCALTNAVEIERYVPGLSEQ